MIRLHLHHNPPSAIKGYRVCPACKREKTTDRFYPERTGEKRCIQCAQKGYKPPEKAKAPGERVIVPTGYKQCRRCEEIKKLTQFHKHKRTSDGRNSWCRDCVIEYSQLRRDRAKTGGDG